MTNTLAGHLTGRKWWYALLAVAAAFAQVLLVGADDTPVSPVLYVLVFGGALWVYLCARGLTRALSGRSAGRR